MFFFSLTTPNAWPNILPSFDQITRLELLKILSVKYVLSKEIIKDSSYELFLKHKDVFVYKNKTYKPLGFTYQNFISRKEMENFGSSEKDSIVQNQIIIENHDIPLFKKHLESTLIQKKNNSEVEFFKINFFENSLIKGNIKNHANSILFFSIPHDEGWEIKINGIKSKYFKSNIGFIALFVSKGSNEIELKYTPPMFKTGILISIISFILFLFYLLFKSKKLSRK